LAPVTLAAEDSAISVLNADEGTTENLTWGALLVWEGLQSGGGLPGTPHSSAATTFVNVNLIYLQFTADFVL
jgi:hypothetical protein